MKLPRHAELWLAGYVRDRIERRPPREGSRVWFAIADHWEPYSGKPPDEVARDRVALWAKHWPAVAELHADSTGRPPQYTFFYPQEEYRPEFLDSLVEVRRRGFGDVDVHIHHNGEGEQNFVDRMKGFLETLTTRHGLLRQYGGRTVFGFIHGNWALDNSLPGGAWCGLNNEITLLRDLGCYADFTMPSGNSPTQSRIVNTIYWATDDPALPKSYDHGVPVERGVKSTGDLLMIPGPFGLRWSERLAPRLEKGEIGSHDLATAYRVQRWLELAPRIGRDIFIKMYTHGCQERHSKALLLAGGFDQLFRLLSETCRRHEHELHYVSTWEMRQAVDAAISC